MKNNSKVRRAERRIDAEKRQAIADTRTPEEWLEVLGERGALHPGSNELRKLKLRLEDVER